MSMFSIDENLYVTPYETEEFRMITDAAVRHLGRFSTITGEIAIDLRKLLANPEGTKVAWARLDLKANARRVAFHMAHAATLETAAAKAHKRAWMTYLDLYHNVAKQNRGRNFRIT